MYFVGFNLRRSKGMFGNMQRYTMWKNVKKGVYIRDQDVIG